MEVYSKILLKCPISPPNEGLTSYKHKKPTITKDIALASNLI